MDRFRILLEKDGANEPAVEPTHAAILLSLTRGVEAGIGSGWAQFLNGPLAALSLWH
jgi:hypothetical protein